MNWLTVKCINFKFKEFSFIRIKYKIFVRLVWFYLKFVTLLYAELDLIFSPYVPDNTPQHRRQ